MEDFLGDDLLASAVHSKLIIIGEAAASLPDEARDAVAGVDWRPIIRFRSLVVHRYFVMNLERVNGIATRDVPALADAVLAHLREHHPLIERALESDDDPESS